jgi:hypothetical protein
MAYNITSAATRGRINVTAGPTLGLDPNQWLVNRDNGYMNLPTFSVNQDEQGAIEVYWNEFQGNYTAGISRYFMAFSTLSVPTQITSATLYVYFSGVVDNNIMIVEATAPTTTENISSGDFKAITGYNNGESMQGNTTNYIDNISGLASAQWNAIPLNSNALNAFNGQPEVRLALVDYDYDYSYQSPPMGASIYTGISISGTEPYLVVETGLGQYVLSISPGATSKVNSVPQSNIKLVNRVAFYQFYRTPIGGSNNIGTNPSCSYDFNGTDPLFAAKSLASLSTGDIVYIDSALTLPYNGGNLYFGLNENIGGEGTYWTGDLYEISAEGVIGDTSENCSF